MLPMARVAIEHGLVLTMDRTGRVIENGRVVVEGRDIVSVDCSTNDPVPDCDLVIDATDGIVLPGLINAHTSHAPPRRIISIRGSARLRESRRSASDAGTETKMIVCACPSVRSYPRS